MSQGAVASRTKRECI